ncbi:hypothetical protein PCANC_07814 [Puccinia coronata f. sp. avenae]|uniref:Uncharacterized protein n=1 Tax=Puccinia coronata f. sp. avenae TaxID=200324 RepID=A0A2N5VC11_9BASI|nr:hypothetical protein PCANC_07814 [Puccinia coronata f. sp. avenae]
MSANNHFSSTINNLPDDPAPPENVTANATHVSGKKEKYRTTSAQAGEPIHPSGSSFHDQITRHKVVLPPQPLSQLVELNCATAAIISSINGQIKEADLLLADGSNYTVWSDFIDKPHSSTAAVSTHINDILEEMESCHLDFSRDCIACLGGLIAARLKGVRTPPPNASTAGAQRPARTHPWDTTVPVPSPGSS